MKYQYLYTSLAVTLLVACEKENKKTLLIDESQQDRALEIQQRNGILIFENDDEFYQAINDLADLSMAERIAWGQLNNFKSQQIIYEELCIAQENFAKENYPNISPDISTEEMAELGMAPQLCPEVESQISSGLITKIHEPDGALSFYPAVTDNGKLYVINNHGMVIIGDRIYQVTPSYIKHKPYSESTAAADIEALERTDSESNNLGVQFIGSEDRSASITIGDIFNQSCNCWVWYNNSSTERFKHLVFIHSYYVSSPEGIYSEYYTSSLAQKKILGVWVKSGGYEPIIYTGGSWGYGPVIGPYYPNPVSWMFQSGSSSPYYENFGTSNEEFEYLFPTGNSSNATPTAPDIWSGDEIEIIDMHIYGSFAGGCCGYSTNYYYN